MIPGNKDYIVKPFNNKDVIWVSVECKDDIAYENLHKRINDIGVQHICSEAQGVIHINAAEFIQIWIIK
jgi:hypothetical protein